jgi:hypothetical protein
MRSCKTSGMLRRQLGILDSAKEGITILRNVIKYLLVDTEQHLGRIESSKIFFSKRAPFFKRQCNIPNKTCQ